MPLSSQEVRNGTTRMETTRLSKKGRKASPKYKRRSRQPWSDKEVKQLRSLVKANSGVISLKMQCRPRRPTGTRGSSAKEAAADVVLGRGLPPQGTPPTISRSSGTQFYRHIFSLPRARHGFHVFKTNQNDPPDLWNTIMPAVKQRACTILGEFERAQTELVGKAVILTDGKAGTVERVWLDEIHGLRISIRGHEGPSRPSNSLRRPETLAGNECAGLQRRSSSSGRAHLYGVISRISVSLITETLSKKEIPRRPCLGLSIGIVRLFP